MTRARVQVNSSGDNVSDVPQEVKQGVQKRFVIVLLCFVAFMLCNMDRVNMSIAILPMQQEFGWTSQTVGIVQSSFFWYARCHSVLQPTSVKCFSP